MSACLDNAEEILEHVLGYCVPRGIPFKFIRSKQLLLLRNGKYAHRGSSGKSFTIYPRDDQQLQVILTELGQLLEGQPGPYILSDLRYGDGPLYVRHGGFAERYCLGASGELELAIADDNGSLVPDLRGPTFSTPEWVPLPDFLVDHLEARNKATVGDLPCRIDGALHFSNGGGLYSGVDVRTGEELVLKEGRPHAGLSTDAADAVTRDTARGRHPPASGRPRRRPGLPRPRHGRRPPLPRRGARRGHLAEGDDHEPLPPRRPRTRRGDHRRLHGVGTRDVRGGGAGRGFDPRARHRDR